MIQRPKDYLHKSSHWKNNQTARTSSVIPFDYSIGTSFVITSIHVSRDCSRTLYSNHIGKTAHITSKWESVIKSGGSKLRTIHYTIKIKGEIEKNIRFNF